MRSCVTLGNAGRLSPHPLNSYFPDCSTKFEGGVLIIFVAAAFTLKKTYNRLEYTNRNYILEYN